MTVFLFVSAFVPMILEARLSRQHDAVLRARGALEPEHDVYRVMQVAYPCAFLAMIAEASLRASRLDALFAAGLGAFVLAKGLKYWAMATLGERWTFRVLVPPGALRIASGPYRLLRHPNYAAVIGELVGFALMGRAAITGPLVTACFAALILIRIRVEERALRTTT